MRLIDFVYHSTLGLRVIKKKKASTESGAPTPSFSAQRGGESVIERERERERARERA